MALRLTFPLYPRLNDTCPPAHSHNAVIRNRLLIHQRIYTNGNTVSYRLPTDNLCARSEVKSLSQLGKWAIIYPANGNTL